MFADFIYRPISGQFPEKHFGQVTPDSSWVKFTDKNFQEWVSSFAQGWEGHATLIINIEERDLAFIVSGGEGYLIDVSEKKLLNQTELSGIKTALLDADRSRIIFSEGLYIECIDFKGNIYTLLDKTFFDEIEFVAIKNNRLYAQYWYYQKGSSPFHFEMNLETNKYFDSLEEQINNSQTEEQPKSYLIEKILKWFRR